MNRFVRTTEGKFHFAIVCRPNRDTLTKGSAYQTLRTVWRAPTIYLMKYCDKLHFLNFIFFSSKFYLNHFALVTLPGRKWHSSAGVHKRQKPWLMTSSYPVAVRTSSKAWNKPGVHWRNLKRIGMKCIVKHLDLIILYPKFMLVC